GLWRGGDEHDRPDPVGRGDLQGVNELGAAPSDNGDRADSGGIKHLKRVGHRLIEWILYAGATDARAAEAGPIDGDRPPAAALQLARENTRDEPARPVRMHDQDRPAGCRAIVAP